MEHYRDGIYAMKQRSDFEILVRERQVDYYFQPIFSARDGHVAAYEALMRPRLPALSSPQRVMELASEMGRLYDIEKLTLFRACECYEALEAAGKLEPDALVFVNSIASVSLNDEDWAHFRAAHKAILSKLVVEITEEDKTFIAEFYKYSFVGILLDWIKQGMNADYRIIAEKISTTMHGNVSNSIQNFARGGRDFTDQGR